MRTDLRLALLLLGGSDRREWWRVGLTALGAALATGFGTAAVAIAALGGDQYSVGLAHGLLNQPGQRAGAILTLVLLLGPVVGFLGQCARIGAVHRDRRLAGLRLAGASPAQVRRIAALEVGLACLVGSVVATAASVFFLLREWQHPPGSVWAECALAVVTIPVLGTLVSVVALRRVVASPLGWVLRVRPQGGRRPGIVLLAAAVVILGAGLILTPERFGGLLTVFTAVVLVGLNAVWLTGATARFMGRRLAARTENPGTLIAAERLRDDPWAAARTHAAVLLVTVVGTGFMGIREVLLDVLHRAHHPMDLSFYTTGIDLTGTAILIALAITLAGLAVGAAESVATRRRGLATQAAAGVPQSVLDRALLLETALPLAPAVALAGAGGMGIGVWYAQFGGVDSVPLLPLAVPVFVYAACLLAAATSLPLLHRSAHTAELRYG
ncbi:FtsX-like permease family protein [Streptomyces sp. V3I7]|uniref:FtsX-like permease family protein n=1 Tax=Streptomyces sp. V3I7 TaxID=3042278 RepID=UPI0027898E57|nr:FtsX-like permease family protein [Streptomyces sp. V3I7]MDQ0990952.1 hypothetical protein [Streptomyces sp. V3I7]